MSVWVWVTSFDLYNESAGTVTLILNIEMPPPHKKNKTLALLMSCILVDDIIYSLEVNVSATHIYCIWIVVSESFIFVI